MSPSDSGGLRQSVGIEWTGKTFTRVVPVRARRSASISSNSAITWSMTSRTARRPRISRR